MTDRLIEAIRGVDPCPNELPAPPIDAVLRRLREECSDTRPPGAGRRRPSLGALAALLSSTAAVAIAVLAIVLLGHGRRAVSPGAGESRPPSRLVGACHSQVRKGVLPAWARAGFTQPLPRVPYTVGAHDRIAAIPFVSLDSPPAADHNNKILWVSRVPPYGGHDLKISAQRMSVTRPLGAPVNRTVTGGPGPSIINLPSPGCWRLTLQWSGWTDQLDLEYNQPS